MFPCSLLCLCLSLYFLLVCPGPGLAFLLLQGTRLISGAPVRSLADRTGLLAPPRQLPEDLESLDHVG